MYNTVYKRSHGPDHVKEISRMIDVHHDTFLAARTQDAKVEALRILRGYAAEFLYQVSHGCKFQLTETERVLSQSVASIADFDPREGSMAFENLAMYAHNLLDQPWRKEFRRIKLTSGYWFHNIKAHLQNAHEMLIVLGYVGTDDYTLELSRPADPLVLRALSRDCYLASQECLILSQIWERVQCEIPDYPLTVFEAYETRKKFMGDTKTIISKLVYEARERQHKEREELEMQQRYARLHQLEAEQKASRRAQNHVEAKRAQHGFVPVDRLIDVDDPKAETELEIVSRVLKNTEKQNETNHRKLYSTAAGGEGRESSSSSTSAISVSTGNSLKELNEVYYDSFLRPKPPKEQLPRFITLDELREHQPKTLGKGKAVAEESRYDTMSLNALLERHNNNITKVDSALAARQRKSESTANRSTSRPDQFGRVFSTSPPRVPSHRSSYSNNGGHINAGEVRNRINGSESEDEPYSLLNDAPTTTKSSYFDTTQPKVYDGAVAAGMTSSSSFKSLKHHQDLPKSTTVTAQPPTANGSSNGGFLSRVSGLMGYKSEKTEKSTPSSQLTTEKEPRKPGALSKSKEPVENELRFESEILDSRCFTNQTLPTPSSSIPLDELFLDESERFLEPRNRTGIAQYDKDNLNTNSEYVKLDREKNMGFVTPPKSEAKPKVETKIEPWDCCHCTFHNEVNPHICEICSKTKDLITEPAVALVEKDYSPTKDKLATSGEWTEVKNKKSSKSQGQDQGQTISVRSYPSSYYPARVTVENETNGKSRSSSSSSSRNPNPRQQQPLVECSKCTLLNPANNDRCECCDERLSYPEYAGSLT